MIDNEEESEMSDKKIWHVVALSMILVMLAAACAPTEAEKVIETVIVTEEVQKEVTPTMKACFIYVGPIGDYGWSHAHNEGRLYVEEQFDWLETAYAESVVEADVDRFLDRFVVEEECDVVFTTSFGFMDGTLVAAEKYPDTLFFHCSGFMRAPNMGTYMADFYQLYYLNGLMAGALSETGKIGYVGAHPIPEVVRHINAFTLGVREANPDATVDVRWLFSWYDPAAAREATEALISAGVDTLAFTEDSPAVVEVGQEYTEAGQPVYTFSHYSPMGDFGPDSAVSGQLVDWGIIYEDILMKAYLGVYDNTNLQDVDYWYLMREGGAILGARFDESINPLFEDDLKAVTVTDPFLGQISVYDLIFTRIQQMTDPAMLFDPFSGPIYDQDGNLQIEAGQRASIGELLSIDWFVEGNIGSIPR
jgi:basic membrane protein A